MRKNLILLLVGLLLLAVASGCSNQAEAKEKIVLRFAYASNSQPVIDSMKEFGRLVFEKTNEKKYQSHL